MKYAYEVQPDGTKTVQAFPDEASRVQWIAASPSNRGVFEREFTGSQDSALPR